MEEDNSFREFADRIIRSEAQLENFFARKVKEAGGLTIKFNPTTNAGLPDRLVFYSGLVWLVELKTPRGVLSPIQKIKHDLFKRYGFNVRVIKTKEQVFEFIEQMKICSL